LERGSREHETMNARVCNAGPDIFMNKKRERCGAATENFLAENISCGKKIERRKFYSGLRNEFASRKFSTSRNRDGDKKVFLSAESSACSEK
jgi:hypothetical protein